MKTYIYVLIMFFHVEELLCHSDVLKVKNMEIQNSGLHYNCNRYSAIMYGCHFITTLEEQCKIAELCVHDQVPMCGIDSCGEMRTFIDTCDMHEVNCDSKKDYKQKANHECWVTCKRGRSFKRPDYRADCLPSKLKN